MRFVSIAEKAEWCVAVQMLHHAQLYDSRMWLTEGLTNTVKQCYGRRERVIWTHTKIQKIAAIIFKVAQMRAQNVTSTEMKDIHKKEDEMVTLDGMHLGYVLADRMTWRNLCHWS